MISNWVLLDIFGFRAFSLGTSGKINEFVFPDRFSLSFIQGFVRRIDITVEVSSKTRFAVSPLRSVYIYIYIHTYLDTYLFICSA